MPASADPPPAGLRERKKARTHAAIQAQALELFRRQGYAATTVAQIADAAEVSESTFFRYFQTKTDVVLWDELDPLIIDAIRAQPPEVGLVDTVRRALRTVFGGLSAEQLEDQRQRTLLSLEVPELRAAMLDQLAQGMQLLAALAAERTGLRPDDVIVRTFAGAVIGAGVAAMFTVAEDPSADLGALMDQALAQLEAGFDARPW